MLIRRIVRTLLAVTVLVTVAAWWITRPQTIAAEDLPDHAPDPEAGERIFWAGGCASCHASPVDGKRAKGDAKLSLGGGLELDTEYGVFRVPNISPDTDDGIGGWSLHNFVNAMQRGVSPDGSHYYPSFPYTSSRGPCAAASARGSGATWLPNPSPSERLRPSSSAAACWSRERDTAGSATHRATASADCCGSAGWQARRIRKARAAYRILRRAAYLESGFTPEFDTVGGSMVAVQENMAKLSDEDRAAIAAYLLALPALD
jgi:mono/diheme cytochrome c family protein